MLYVKANRYSRQGLNQYFVDTRILTRDFKKYCTGKLRQFQSMTKYGFVHHHRINFEIQERTISCVCLSIYIANIGLLGLDFITSTVPIKILCVWYFSSPACRNMVYL